MAKAKAKKVDEKALLIRMSDSNLTFADGAQDIRRRKVVDSNGEELGKVDDLFVDQGEEKVRFLEISAGGFLGLGDTKFLLPVDAITSVKADELRIDRTRAHVAGAPRFSPELVDARFLTNIYEYYGYEPYWGAGYTSPRYPYYPTVP
ncbi:MAG: PRC-barrel domain-containing protein [Acidobacteria bacterium]|nr:PRC-barrel domain-containing protein [Acidobacteriota bacterium]MBI3427855.1 PRC-barrel domain-containing protein [Acidobacteriota bacterium]